MIAERLLRHKIGDIINHYCHKNKFMANFFDTDAKSASRTGPLSVCPNGRLHYDGAAGSAPLLLTQGGNMSGRMQGKVAIITGAASGIGRAAAILFAREGAEAVIIADIDETGGGEMERLVRNAGAQALYLRTDVSQPADANRVVAEAVRRYGRLDVLINNAFWAVLNRPVTETTDDDLNRTLDVTLKGAFHCCRAAIPAMVASGGGSIINMSSVAGTHSSPRFAAYSVAKGGIGALTRSVAFDYGPQGIRANTVAPGTIDTPAIASILADPARRDYLASRILLGRIGQPEDIANAMLFLASDESSFMTGQVMVVDGGRSIC